MPEKNPNEGIAKIEKNIAQLEAERAKLKKELRGKEIDTHISQTLKASNVNIGEAKNKVRSPCEQLGVYFKGNHIGDIITGEMTIPMEKLSQEISKILKENNIPHTAPEDQEKIGKISIDNASRGLLKKWKGSVNEKKIDFGVAPGMATSSSLDILEDTKKISISKIGENTLLISCEDNDGTITIISCENQVPKIVQTIEAKK